MLLKSKCGLTFVHQCSKLSIEMINGFYLFTNLFYRSLKNWINKDYGYNKNFVSVFEDH